VVATAPDAPCLDPLQWPVQLAQQLRLSPEQFELVCEANPDAVLELSADGHLITMTPTGSETSARNSTLVVLLGLALRASHLPDASRTLAGPDPGTTAQLLAAAAAGAGHHPGCRRARPWSADRLSRDLAGLTHTCSSGTN